MSKLNRTPFGVSAPAATAILSLALLTPGVVSAQSPAGTVPRDAVGPFTADMESGCSAVLDMPDDVNQSTSGDDRKIFLGASRDGASCGCVVQAEKLSCHYLDPDGTMTSARLDESRQQARVSRSEQSNREGRNVSDPGLVHQIRTALGNVMSGFGKYMENEDGELPDWFTRG